MPADSSGNETGRSAAWLAHSLGVREVGSSNLLAPTIANGFSFPAVDESLILKPMATAEIELVDVSPEEKDELRTVFQEYLRELERMIGHDVPPGKEISYPEWERYWDGTPGHMLFWIVIGGGKVGFIFFREFTEQEWPTLPRPLKMTEFNIYRSFRGRNIGSSVLTFLLEDFYRRGDILTWDCLKKNTQAEKMYDRVLADFARGDRPHWIYEKTQVTSAAGPMWRYSCGPA